MLKAAPSRPAPTRAETAALNLLMRLAHATTHERGDIQVGRVVDASDRLRLEAWAREVEPDLAGASLSPRLRADAEMAAHEMGGRLEVSADPVGRKVIFRIEVPGGRRRRSTR